MSWPSLKTYDRIDPEPGQSRGFERSYFGMRLVIGAIGVLLPILLVMVDYLLIDQPLSFRGSMSAYYHSPARDLFVGGLAASGVTLISYMFWKWWTWDFLISLIGGVAVLGVAAFPTARPRDAANTTNALTCAYQHEGVPPCTALQTAWGEDTVRTIHLYVTAAVVISFAVLCLVFALRDFGYGRLAHEVVGADRTGLGPIRIWRKLRTEKRRVDIVRCVWQKAPRTVLYLLCLVGVLIGAAWAPFGRDILVPHTYGGEFVAFFSFGLAWIVASWDLLKETKLASPVVTVGRTLGVQY